MSRLNGSLVCCAGDVSQHRSNWDYYDETIIFRLIHFQKSGLKPPTSVGKDPTVRRRRSKPLNPSTLVGGGSVGSLYLLKK